MATSGAAPRPFILHVCMCACVLVCMPPCRPFPRDIPSYHPPSGLRKASAHPGEEEMDPGARRDIAGKRHARQGCGEQLTAGGLFVGRRPRVVAGSVRYKRRASGRSTGVGKDRPAGEGENENEAGWPYREAAVAFCFSFDAQPRLRHDVGGGREWWRNGEIGVHAAGLRNPDSHRQSRGIS